MAWFVYVLSMMLSSIQLFFFSLCNLIMWWWADVYACCPSTVINYCCWSIELLHPLCIALRHVKSGHRSYCRCCCCRCYWSCHELSLALLGFKLILLARRFALDCSKYDLSLWIIIKEAIEIVLSIYRIILSNPLISRGSNNKESGSKIWYQKSILYL